MRPLRSATRRVLGAAAALTALGGSFTAGVVAGAGSAPAAPPAGVLDEAAARIAATALQPVDPAVLEAAAVDGMLAAAGDAWGSRAASGATGVGVWLQRAPDGTVVVARVSASSPAAAAGVRAGEQVRGVDDVSVRGLPTARVAALLRGPAGSLVRVTLARGAVVRTLPLRRAATPSQPEVRAVAHDGVARVVVSAFAQGTGRRVREAVSRLVPRAPRGVLLDLRGNPGGRLDEAVEVASVFLERGPVVAYAGRAGQPRRLDVLRDGDSRTPLVVLVDGGTASAAEVVAGALQDRGRAVLVGARTYGKGTVQEPLPLRDGSALELTVARWTTPAGRTLDGVGLVPDIEVAPGASPQVAERRAVEVLTGLRAGAGAGG